MANLGMELNAQDMPEKSGFEPLPDGWYHATIQEVDLRNSNDGTSTFMNIRYGINGPTHAGRVVFGMCGVTNVDPKKEETSRYFLGQLMRACGVAKLQDTDQLIGQNLQIKLTLKPAVMETINGVETEKWPAGNNVKEYKAIAGSAMPAQSAPVASGGSKPPWQK